ncbi:MAG TPA: RNA-binding domain-containing protein [Candidatus Rhabdochlamydia sp.]|nr:RNA-binding domain-containing protein [Candidatus Rhabdochlamydia sp.]
MDLNELKKIISRGEDSCHQFKEDIRNGDSLAAEMVAFSNSRGGYIFIGVSNKGDLIGLSSRDVDRINQLISNSASQHVRSPIAVHTENISVNSDRTIIILAIPKGIDKPYFDNQGVIWLKSGADKRRIHSKEELRRLFQEADLLHADEIPTRAGIETINSKNFLDFIKNVYNEVLPDSNLERLKLLENMNLSSNNRLNLAGLLLFGDKPQLYKPEFIVKSVTFAGTDISDSYLDSEDFEGSLSTIFQGALAFIMRNLRKIQKQKGVNTIGEPEIPQIVFEELLVNALIHRDYFISAPVRLFIFDNRVEIINPGNLPDHLTIEKIRTGNSIQRNPILASFAAKGLLPYRGLGTGIRRALQDWSKIQFIDDRDGCLFTSLIERIMPLREPNAPISAPINAPINAPVSELQIQILKIIKQDPWTAYEDIAIKLEKDPSTIKRNIQQLKFLGVLQRSGSKKKGYWKIMNTPLPKGGGF